MIQWLEKRFLTAVVEKKLFKKVFKILLLLVVQIMKVTFGDRSLLRLSLTFTVRWKVSDNTCSHLTASKFVNVAKPVTKEIVFGKRYLKNPLDTFIFSKELFHSSAKMLTRIRELCPQSRSLPDGIAQGIFSLKRKLQDAQNLLQYIEVLIFVLNMQSLPIQQDMTVKDFAEKWKSRIPSPFPVDLLPEPKASIQLAHITVLYEALEDLLADGTIEGLSSQFRIELTDEMKARLNSLEDSRNNSPKLKQLLTALRRFVFRYLSVEKLIPEPHTPLRCCLDEPSLWSPDKALDVDVIPNDMMLENIQATIRYLEKVSLLDSKLVNDKIYISQTVL